MRNLSRLAALAAFLLAATLGVSADIPNPKLYPQPQAPKGAEARMRIVADGGAAEVQLVIPRALLQELGTEAGEGNAAPAAGLFGGSPGEARTVVAGVFLSLAFVLGGVWLVRSRRGVRPRAALGALALAVLTAAGGAVYANAPPPRTRALNWNILVAEAKRNGAAGPVRVTVAEEGYEVVLILPKNVGAGE